MEGRDTNLLDAEPDHDQALPCDRLLRSDRVPAEASANTTRPRRRARGGRGPRLGGASAGDALQPYCAGACRRGLALERSRRSFRGLLLVPIATRVVSAARSSTCAGTAAARGVSDGIRGRWPGA